MRIQPKDISFVYLFYYLLSISSNDRVTQKDKPAAMLPSIHTGNWLKSLDGFNANHAADLPNFPHQTFLLYGM